MEQDRIIEILKQRGFKQNSSLKNSLRIYNYKAIVWLSGYVTISIVTPNTGRFLSEKTYEDENLLVNYLDTLPFLK